VDKKSPLWLLNPKKTWNISLLPGLVMGGARVFTIFCPRQMKDDSHPAISALHRRQILDDYTMSIPVKEKIRARGISITDAKESIYG